MWRSVGNRSAISRRLKTVSGLSATAATGRRSVANQLATCRRPPKTFLRSIWSQRGFTCSNQNLLATKSSLQPSATGRQPPRNHPATSLQPPEILVARRSPTGCKLCVTGALVIFYKKKSVWQYNNISYEATYQQRLNIAQVLKLWTITAGMLILNILLQRQSLIIQNKYDKKNLIFYVQSILLCSVVSAQSKSEYRCFLNQTFLLGEVGPLNVL